MLLRLRVELPDRPGALGQVARTLGVVGADIVQVVVLERVHGRAVDDFTVVWPASAAVDRVLAGLSAMPGVRVAGVWRATELPEPAGREVSVVGQVAGNPARGLRTLADAAPGVFAAEWAVVATIGEDWAVAVANANADADAVACGVDVVCGSWRAPDVPPIPDLTPLRPRTVTRADGTHLAAAPLRRAGLILVVARGGTGAVDAEAGLFAPPFHRSEVERMAQLVEAVGAVLGARLDSSSVVPAPRSGLTAA
jgi:hypothetical protein